MQFFPLHSTLQIHNDLFRRFSWNSMFADKRFTGIWNNHAVAIATTPNPQSDIGEGDSICEISHELVLDNWQSVPHTIPQECPFLQQITHQHRKVVR